MLFVLGRPVARPIGQPPPLGASINCTNFSAAMQRFEAIEKGQIKVLRYNRKLNPRAG
jgi:hypothetical protein